jgi:hypothetical protein
LRLFYNAGLFGNNSLRERETTLGVVPGGDLSQRNRCIQNPEEV